MKRIRLIEDDPGQREIRAMLLEAKGYRIVPKGDRADLVLMDLRIPKLCDGLTEIRELKAQVPAPKVVVLSGAVADLRGCEEAALVDAVLEKPCPTGLLLRTLQTLLALFILPALMLAETKDCKRHAPILYQRADTIGTQSDIPLLMYCEWDDKDSSLTYTVIFSNEDGGTSTRALMARWGRTTDIEYVYQVWLNPDGGAIRSQIQTRDHKDAAFTGPYEGERPVLVPVTRNNMVEGAAAKTGQRYDFDPIPVDLREHSREYVMDLKPETWKIMREELQREGKLRAYGTLRGEDISDPANYASIEMKSVQRDGARIAAGIELRGAPKMQMGHLGDPRFAIERSGWMRTAIELPPATRLDAIGQVAFACYGKGSCLLEKIAFIDLNGKRAQIALNNPIEIKAGEIWFSKLK